MTSGVFQRLMAQTFPEVDVFDVGKLLLNYVLSDDVASRIDLAKLHDRNIR